NKVLNSSVEKLPVKRIYGNNFSCGVGIIFDKNDNWKCMDDIEAKIVGRDGNPVLQNQKGNLGFRGHTIFDKLLTKEIDDCDFVKNNWFVTEIDIKNI
ncbi:MAG: hypothetical protein U9R41_00740, partial [Candidatus Marinimicrobia bacterium]|nr:hypothetical protein [Candidatus Neomarinimicrobiota bacterium]